MGETGFDPLSDLFRAQHDRPADWEPVNLRTLRPHQRALLVIDGTVTKFLEAYTLEPIEVVRLAQAQHKVAVDNPWLEIDADSEVAVRHVMIRGRYSRRFYVYAVSWVLLDRLPDEIRRRVEEDDEGLGRILNQNKLETRREVLWYGRETVSELPDEVREVSDGRFLSRTYRILVGGRPIMMINEKFPLKVEDLPAHE